MGRMDGSGIGIGTEMVMDSVEALQGRIAQLEVENSGLKRQVEKLKLGTIDHECDKRLKARIAELEGENGRLRSEANYNETAFARLKAENERLRDQAAMDQTGIARMKEDIFNLKMELAKIAMAPRPEAAKPRMWRSYSFGQPVECTEPSVATLKATEMEQEIKAWRGEVDDLRTVIRIIAKRLL